MPFQKVYWKELREELDDARRYIAVWQLKLQQNLTEEQYNCVVDTLQAIISCLALLPQNTPEP